MNRIFKRNAHTGCGGTYSYVYKVNDFIIAFTNLICLNAGFYTFFCIFALYMKSNIKVVDE